MESDMKLPHLVSAALACAIPVAAIAADPVLMHRDPGCPCCEKWVRQAKAQFGRAAKVVDDAARPAFMKARGVPADLASCHTAVIDGMTFEGHVPVADMKRALATRPGAGGENPRENGRGRCRAASGRRGSAPRFGEAPGCRQRSKAIRKEEMKE